MSSEVGRNEPCPCGSGKKHKNCCHKRGVLLDKKKQNKIVLGVMVMVVVVAGIIAYSKMSPSLSTGTQSPISQPTSTGNSTRPLQTTTSTTVSSSVANTPQPPGPVPPGKVWSAEHGHWHDVPSANVISSSNPLEPNSTSPKFDILPGQETAQPQAKNVPQPPGLAPTGQVWSSEHGHWHNLPGTGQPTASGVQPVLTPQPPGPAPAGKVWYPEHGHWHDLPAEAKVIEVNPSKSDPK